MYFKMTMMYCAFLLLLVTPFASSQQFLEGLLFGDQCSMCEDPENATLAFPNRIIPFMGIRDVEDPTCQQVADIAHEFTKDSIQCRLIFNQASWCGCPEADWEPSYTCTLCPRPDNDETFSPSFSPTVEPTVSPTVEPTAGNSTFRQDDPELGWNFSTSYGNNSIPHAEYDRNGNFSMPIGNSDGNYSRRYDGNYSDGNNSLPGDWLLYDGNNSIDIGNSSDATLSPIDDLSTTIPRPGDPDFMTLPDNDTCAVLDAYLAYQNENGCTTGRVKDIQRYSWLCKCPNSTTVCSLCPDGSVDLTNENKVIPFFYVRENNELWGSPTCGELRNMASVQDPDAEEKFFDCNVIQKQAGYCGCRNMTEINACSFCPDDSDPKNLDYVTPSGDTCRDLNDYFKHFTEDQCDGPQADSISGMRYVCGCPGLKSPNCELCPERDEDGEERIMKKPEKIIQDLEMSCADFELLVSTASATVCEDQGFWIRKGRKACCPKGANQQSGSTMSAISFQSKILSLLLILGLYF